MIATTLYNNLMRGEFFSRHARKWVNLFPVSLSPVSFSSVSFFPGFAERTRACDFPISREHARSPNTSKTSRYRLEKVEIKIVKSGTTARAVVRVGAQIRLQRRRILVKLDCCDSGFFLFFYDLDATHHGSLAFGV